MLAHPIINDWIDQINLVFILPSLIRLSFIQLLYTTQTVIPALVISHIFIMTMKSLAGIVHFAGWSLSKYTPLIRFIVKNVSKQNTWLQNMSAFLWWKKCLLMWLWFMKNFIPFKNIWELTNCNYHVLSELRNLYFQMILPIGYYEQA